MPTELQALNERLNRLRQRLDVCRVRVLSISRAGMRKSRSNHGNAGSVMLPRTPLGAGIVPARFPRDGAGGGQ